MAKDLNTLVGAGSARELQEKLENWQQNYEMNSSGENLTQCCEILELNTAIQKQLFSILNETSHGEKCAAKIKSCLLPSLCCTTSGSDNQDSSGGELQLRDLSGSSKCHLQDLENKITETCAQINQMEHDLKASRAEQCSLRKLQQLDECEQKIDQLRDEISMLDCQKSIIQERLTRCCSPTCRLKCCTDPCHPKCCPTPCHGKKCCPAPCRVKKCCPAPCLPKCCPDPCCPAPCLPKCCPDPCCPDPCCPDPCHPKCCPDACCPDPCHPKCCPPCPPKCCPDPCCPDPCCDPCHPKCCPDPCCADPCLPKCCPDPCCPDPCLAKCCPDPCRPKCCPDPCLASCWPAPCPAKCCPAPCIPKCCPDPCLLKCCPGPCCPDPCCPDPCLGKCCPGPCLPNCCPLPCLPPKCCLPCPVTPCRALCVRPCSPPVPRRCGASYRAYLISRYNFLYAKERLDAENILRPFVCDMETVQRIIYVAAVESFRAAKMAFWKVKINVKDTFAICHKAGPASLEAAVLDYIACHKDLYDVCASVHEVVCAMNKNPKLPCPGEVDYLVISCFIRELCCLAFSMQTLIPALDIAFGIDGEFFNRGMYYRSFDSDFTAPFVAYHIWPALVEDGTVIVKGEVVTKKVLTVPRSRSLSTVRVKRRC